MNISTSLAILTSALGEPQYYPGKTYIKAAETYRDGGAIGARPAPREHQYSPGNTDIYACEPQYDQGKTYIKGKMNIGKTKQKQNNH